MSDQTFINDRNVSQLDVISKCLDAIENSPVSDSTSTSVSKLHAAPMGGKQSMKTADSNLKVSADNSVKHLDAKMPDLNSIRHG